MEVKVYTPQSEILKEVIDCFYILKKSKHEADATYVTFPNTFSILSLAVGVTVDYNNHHITVKESNSKSVASFIVSKFPQPICFNYVGSIEEITIYFKPLGLYSFIKEDLNTYPDGSSFKPFTDYDLEISRILNTKLDDEKILQLENYLLSKYTGAKHTFLQGFIEELSHTQNLEVPISSLIKNYNISSKNLIKHFERHTCKTPSLYKKTLRFRQAMQKYLSTKNKNSLTKLTYHFNYADQSHLIKEFKSLTGFTPSYFFKNLSPLQNGKVNWVFK